MNVCIVDNVSPESNLTLVELTFSAVWGDTGLLDPFEQCEKALIVLLLIGSKDKNIIHHADGALQSSENFHHPLLYVLGSRGDTEWQATKQYLPRRVINVVNS